VAITLNKGQNLLEFTGMQWMPIEEAFNTRAADGFMPKEWDLARVWRRCECEPMPDPKEHFLAVVTEVRNAYARDDHGASVDLWSCIRVNDKVEGLVVPFPTSPQELEVIALGPGKVAEKLPEWCDDFERQIQENQERIIGEITANDQPLRRQLEEMASFMKAKWERASELQKEAWRTRKQTTFSAEGLNTRPIDLICSFESRWKLFI
jgi:hypothetical protein